MSLKLDIIIGGNSFRVDAIITDYDGTPWDPTTQSIQLYTPAGVASGAALTAPTKVGIGSYTQEITLPATPSGRWKVRWSCVSGTAKVSSSDIYFDVIL